MTNPVRSASSPAALDSLTQPTVRAYFESLNAGNFQVTANLFAVEGQLLPPFEAAIVGRDEILTYLETEATGMNALPEAEIQESSSADAVSVDVTSVDVTSVDVVGKVQTALFVVNVKWQFRLNSQSEILSVKIKLLASLQDLLHLKR